MKAVGKSPSCVVRVLVVLETSCPRWALCFQRQALGCHLLHHHPLVDSCPLGSQVEEFRNCVLAEWIQGGDHLVMPAMGTREREGGCFGSVVLYLLTLVMFWNGCTAICKDWLSLHCHSYTFNSNMNQSTIWSLFFN